MNGKPTRSRRTRFQSWAVTAAALAALCWTGWARAQTGPQPAKNLRLRFDYDPFCLSRPRKRVGQEEQFEQSICTGEEQGFSLRLCQLYLDVMPIRRGID